MSSPARDAKFVTAIVVSAVGAGTFAGVSHDGRGGAAPETPATTTAVLAPSTSTLASTVASTPSVTSTLVTSTLAAEPAPPDPVPTRARVRSRGS